MANSKDCSFLPPRILTFGGLVFLLMFFFFISASSQAEVVVNGTTFSGSGTYDQAVNSTSDLTVTPDDGATITFANNIVTTGTFTLSKGKSSVVFNGNNNSVSRLITKCSSETNNAQFIINGNLTITDNIDSLYLTHSGGTSHLYINPGATLTAAGAISINTANNSQGIVHQLGGTVNFNTANRYFRIGHFNNKNYTSQYNISGGTLNVPNISTSVGHNANGELNILDGVANLKGLILSEGNAKGFLNLFGGELKIGSNGVSMLSGKETPSVNLGQGTITAAESHTWASDIPITLTGRSSDGVIYNQHGILETAGSDVPGGVTIFNTDENKTITISGVISGVGALTKTGTGTLTLSQAPAYTGNTTIESGTLELTAGGTLNNLSGGSDSNPVTLEATGKALTLNNTEMTKFIGSITASSVTVKAKDDAPFQIYTAANGLVDAGSFVVSSGRVDVKGYMKGAVEVGENATFSPGNSVGNVSIDGDFTLNGDLLIEVDATGADTLVCDGFTLNGGTAILNWQDDEIPFFATCDLITSTSDLSDVYANLEENLDFSTSPKVEQLFNDGYITLALAGDSNNIIRLSIDRNAVPEPSTWALLALGVIGLMYWRKRK